MKAIIVFNWERMPDNCIECPLCQGEGYPHCTAIYKSHGSLSWYFDGDKEKNPYCPLKPMPQKKSHEEYSWGAEKIETTNDFEDGWNDCIEEIEKC